MRRRGHERTGRGHERNDYWVDGKGSDPRLVRTRYKKGWRARRSDNLGSKRGSE